MWALLLFRSAVPRTTVLPNTRVPLQCVRKPWPSADMQLRKRKAHSKASEGSEAKPRRRAALTRWRQGAYSRQGMQRAPLRRRRQTPPRTQALSSAARSRRRTLAYLSCCLGAACRQHQQRQQQQSTLLTACPWALLASPHRRCRRLATSSPKQTPVSRGLLLLLLGLLLCPELQPLLRQMRRVCTLLEL